MVEPVVTSTICVCVCAMLLRDKIVTVNERASSRADSESADLPQFFNEASSSRVDRKTTDSGVSIWLYLGTILTCPIRYSDTRKN